LFKSLSSKTFIQPNFLASLKIKNPLSKIKMTLV
jgi:hypothetical protein